MKKFLTALSPLLSAVLLFTALLLCGCGDRYAGGGAALPDTQGTAVSVPMELKYAEQFSVAYRPDGAAELVIAGTERYLVVPPDWTGSEGEAEDGGAVLLRKPLWDVYIAATAAMDLISCLDALPAVGYTSMAAADWGLPEVREAMEAGTVRFAGKYSAPDFELLVSMGCPLAVENTMIWHSPEIQEKLEALGIPVLVERSSYEPHPLGRMEWVKVYGLLLDREAEAAAFFERQAAVLENLEPLPPGGSVTAAFFSINAAGGVVVRQPGDYVSKLIQLAGGRYAFDDLPGADNARSTVTLQMERFYQGAKDADVLFYNSTIEGELAALGDLLERSPLLKDFRGVKNGNVWCVSHDMYQKSSAAAEILREMNEIFCGITAEKEAELRFFRRLV